MANSVCAVVKQGRKNQNGRRFRRQNHRVEDDLDDRTRMEDDLKGSNTLPRKAAIVVNDSLSLI